MHYGGLTGRESLEGVERSELTMSDEIGGSVSAGYLDSDICL